MQFALTALSTLGFLLAMSIVAYIFLDDAVERRVVEFAVYPSGDQSITVVISTYMTRDGEMFTQADVHQRGFEHMAVLGKNARMRTLWAAGDQVHIDVWIRPGGWASQYAHEITPGRSELVSYPPERYKLHPYRWARTIRVRYEFQPSMPDQQLATDQIHDFSPEYVDSR